MCSEKNKQKTQMLKHLIWQQTEAKTMTKHISCDCKCKFNRTTGNSNLKWNNKTCQCKCKNYRTSKKDYSWDPSTCICENNKYLKNIADTSVIACDEIISAMDMISTKLTNIIATNVPINSDDKKVRYKIDCYILHTYLIVIISLLMIINIFYHYTKHRSKQKGINVLTI